ncbi:MAG: hypothetical protein GX224_01770 [Thermoplasmatales archaeon]|nr:hypothetical protein [Thermoplasmatales archaeon]
MGSPKETVTSRLVGEGIGPTPVFLRDLTLGLDAAGIHPREVFTPGYDHVKSARAVVAMQRLSGQDAVVGCIHSAAFIVEQFGGAMAYPEHAIPNVANAPFADFGDTAGHDPVPMGKAEGALKSYSEVRGLLPEVAVAGNVTGPMTKASVLMGMDVLALAIQAEPGYVEDVIALGLENTECVFERFSKDSSVDFIFLAAASDNPELFGPDAYGKHCLGYLGDIVKACRRHGFPVAFHPHGDFSGPFRNLLPKTLSTGISGFQFSEGNDPSTIAADIGGACALMGGTDVVPTLHSGDIAAIESETRRYMGECVGPRYVFMPSCSLHMGLPLENVAAMVFAARAFSVDQRP